MKDHKNRKKRKRAEKFKKDHTRLEKKRRLELILSTLGLLRGFENLPGRIRDAFIANLPSRPKVVVAPAALNLPNVETVKQGIENALENGHVFTEEEKSFPVADLLTVCRVLSSGFMHVASAQLSREQNEFAVDAAKKVATFMEEKFDFQIDLLTATIMTELTTYSRVDGRVVGCIFDVIKRSSEEPTLQFTIVTCEPREIRVAIDGKKRPAIQCAIPFGLGGIKWAEADGGAFGLQAGRMYPIYIQSHAVRRLRERLSATHCPEYAIELGLMTSIFDLAVIDRQGDRCLIEFHICGIRIGYLAARMVEDKIVIVTFLFLTMEGTPENRLLKRRLGVTGRDITYLGLDRLETFLSPDVIANKQLMSELRECGCGELLHLERLRSPQVTENGRAEEIRRYLRLTEGDKQKQFHRLGVA